MDPQLFAIAIAITGTLGAGVQWQLRTMRARCDACEAAHELSVWKINVLVGALQRAELPVPDEFWATEIPKRRRTDLEPIPPLNAVPPDEPKAS